MSTLPPPPRARHLRLVPPLPDAAWPQGEKQVPHPGRPVGQGACRPMLTAYSEAPYLHHTGALLHGPRPLSLPMGDTPGWLKWCTVALAFVLLLWLCGGPHMLTPTGAPAPQAPRGGLAGTFQEVPSPIEPGPSFRLYARAGPSGSLGRPLMEGDTLFAQDHLVLGIHNAPSPGAEAAQFAAVFALDAERHIAALYPALGATAVAMPLPQVASMALLDGPQLSGAKGEVTLVAVFLRHAVGLGALMEALQRPAPEASGLADVGDALRPSVVRLQRMTLLNAGPTGPTP